MTRSSFHNFLNLYAVAGSLLAVFLLIAGWIQTEKRKSEAYNHILLLNDLKNHLNKVALSGDFNERSSIDEKNLHRLSKQVYRLCNPANAMMSSTLSFTVKPLSYRTSASTTTNDHTATMASMILLVESQVNETQASINAYSTLVSLLRAGSLLFLLVIACMFLWLITYGINKPVTYILQRLDGNNDLVAPQSFVPQFHKLFLRVEECCVVQADTLRFIEGLSEERTERSAVLPFNNPLTHALTEVEKKIIALADKEKETIRANENLSRLEELLKTEHDQSSLHTRLLTLLTKSVTARAGALYGFNDTGQHQHFVTLASYGVSTRIQHKILLGEGQLGEAGLRKRTVLLEHLPASYVTIQSGLGEANATHVVIVPLLFKEELYGAIELAFFKRLENDDLTWLERAAESIAAHFFNRKIQEQTQKQLEAVAKKQELELIEIRQLQAETYQKLEWQFNEVQQEKARNQAILEGCVDGVISFDEAGLIIFCNTAMRSMLGYDQFEIEQRKIGDLIPVEINHSSQRSRVLYTHTQTEITIRTEIPLTDSHGQLIDVLITSSQFNLQQRVVFNFFIQKISADLF